MKVLFIVDVQKGFIKDFNKHVVENINKLLKNYKFDKIYATKFVNYKNSQFEKFLNWNRMETDSETEIVVKIPKETKIINKTSYALPYNFIKKLKINSIDDIYICGLDYDACVLAIGFQLFDLGLQPKFIMNAISTANKNPIKLEQFENIIKRNFGENCVVTKIPD